MSSWEQVPKEYYTRLGNSGLKISRIIVGCMSFGDKVWGDWILDDKKQVFEILKKAYDEGIRTYDTADTYSNGASEKLLGEFLKEYKIKRDKVVILSKVFYPCDPDTPGFNQKARKTMPAFEYINSQGLSRKHIFDAAKASVERLGTYIDVLQIHRFDPETPIEETMEALHDVVKEGYTRYIGASSMKAYQFAMLQTTAEKHGWTKFISMQNYYNVIHREEEREMIEYCKLTNVGLIPWSPNARGVLTRPLSQKIGTTNRMNSDGKIKWLIVDSMTDADKEIINRVEELSKKYNVAMATISTAWVLSKGCSPIVGFSKPERIDDAIAALKLKLSDEDLKYLEEPYAPKENAW
ncbi:unnamed protein product [Ambrosiozyma monospora]|uniref:Unnamed protein product n=1 Tax=Ambrosiozyma monospora TaxID=43982 RepID=A0ACB5SSQ4_AMBMO|nr:unnamed protein product [Ambrosiozyma monospora]